MGMRSFSSSAALNFGGADGGGAGVSAGAVDAVGWAAAGAGLAGWAGARSGSMIEQLNALTTRRVHIHPQTGGKSRTHPAIWSRSEGARQPGRAYEWRVKRRNSVLITSFPTLAPARRAPWRDQLEPSILWARSRQLPP